MLLDEDWSEPAYIDETYCDCQSGPDVRIAIALIPNRRTRGTRRTRRTRS